MVGIFNLQPSTFNVKYGGWAAVAQQPVSVPCLSPVLRGEGTNVSIAISTGMTGPGGTPAGFLPRRTGAVRPPVPVQRAQALWIEDGFWADSAFGSDAYGWWNDATLECQALKINRVLRNRMSRVVTTGG